MKLFYVWECPLKNAEYVGYLLLLKLNFFENKNKLLFFLQTFQAGTYTCTAYNDLDKLKTSVQLKVFYKPNCRIRNQETRDGGLNLR